MSTYRKGLENLPLQHFDKDPYPIKVFVIDLKNNDDVVATYDLDYSNFEHRKHIGRLTHWAIRNNHSIETMSAKDAEEGC